MEAECFSISLSGKNGDLKKKCLPKTVFTQFLLALFFLMQVIMKNKNEKNFSV